MSKLPLNIRKILDTPFELSDEQINNYRTNGFIKLKNVLSPTVIKYMQKVISTEVHRLNTQHLPLAERDTYNKAFLQVMNIWTQSETVKSIVFSKRLAKLATDLMGVKGVRIYHDQALYKEAGGGFTPWHADQYYWPLSNDNTVTVWMPLQATPLEMGALEFSAKSQLLQDGRTLKISDDSENIIYKKLTLNDFAQIVEPFDIGEVSFHSGWVFHRAGANQTDKMREVMTIIYMDKDMKLIQPTNSNQKDDWETWCPNAVVGEVIASPINPILFEY
jgi:ectoine hydroxylase-related dioxygenase (phytanoyl-CoA dioxygenase family)